MGIRIKNLSITYANGHKALQEINLDLSSGKIYALVGINGAGKSTLFKSIMGLIKSEKNSILIDQTEIQTALQNNIVSYVPQTEEVDWDFPLRVKDIVMMGRYPYMNFLKIPSAHDKEVVHQSLQRVGLLELKERQIGQLSGGQKKRVFVARSLAQESKIILLDEPFTGVDIKTEDSLIDLFQSLSKEGHLILVSTHNLGSVPRFCDEVILLNKRVIAYGEVKETFTQENLSQTFGGKLRHFKVDGSTLHDDSDPREITVLSDDEIPLVFYGEQNQQKIVKKNKNRKK